MPVRVTAMKAVDEASVQTMHHFDEDHYALRKRVERFATDRMPGRRTRRAARGTTSRTSARLLAVIPQASPSWRAVCCCSAPVVTGTSRASCQPAGATCWWSRMVLRLRERLITVDESVLRTQNLAVFL